MKKPPELFSSQLKRWLDSKQPKTIASISDVFGKKTFTIAILLLMLFPALPIPTGGITHVLEVAVMLLSLEMIAGLGVVWLPKKLKNQSLGQLAQKKIIPFFYNKIVWVEKRSRPIGGFIMNNKEVSRLSGLFLLVMAVLAFLSPPFSGLDTIPSLAAVLICLGIIFEDIRIYIFGCLAAIASLAIVIFFGAVITEFIYHLF